MTKAQHLPPETGGRQPFSWAEVGENTVCLNVGGDITITDNWGKVILLGNCSKGDDTIINLIDLLQRQMNCVRGI